MIYFVIYLVSVALAAFVLCSSVFSDSEMLDTFTKQDLKDLILYSILWLPLLLICLWTLRDIAKRKTDTNN